MTAEDESYEYPSMSEDGIFEIIILLLFKRWNKIYIYKIMTKKTKKGKQSSTNKRYRKFTAYL